MDLLAWRCLEFDRRGIGDYEVLANKLPQGKSFAIVLRLVPAHDFAGLGFRDRVGKRLAVGEYSFGLYALEQRTVQLRWRKRRDFARSGNVAAQDYLQRNERDEGARANSPGAWLHVERVHRGNNITLNGDAAPR
jgi:hypothetical protein